MNAKRQTIWLVSMLSLMVILSAYYLFTEDVNSIDLTSSKPQQDEIKVMTQESNSQLNVNAKGANVNTNSVKSSSGQLTDQQVLKQLAAQGASGSDFMYQMQIKRNDDLKVQTDKLFTIINDSKKSDDEVKKAYEQLDKIQQNQQKTQDIEDALGKQFRNVIVTQEGNKYRVTVQSDKLERSQSVSIIDLVMHQLNVSADKVEVTRIQ